MKLFRRHISPARLLEFCIMQTIRCLLPLIWLLSWWRQRHGRIAALWGTTPILTLPKLAAADRLLGFTAHSLTHTTYYITSAFDYVCRRHVELLAKRAPNFVRCYYRIVFLLALLRYDVFHYFYDQGILERDGRIGVSEEELRWLRRAGKRVYLYAYGADVRTRILTTNMGEFHQCMHCDDVGVHCLCDDAEGTRKQAMYDQYVTAKISMGDMMAHVPGARNLHYWPIDVESTKYLGIRLESQRPLRILHVPNHGWAKGARYLYAALENLERRGIRFEFMQVSKKSNTEILRLMGEADIIADQFINGWHGYTALEAMALGKIVLCYIRSPDMLINAEECPIVSASPAELEAVLADLAQWPIDRIIQTGRAGRAYVERYYSIPAMATRLAQLYIETAGFGPHVNERLLESKSQLSIELEAKAPKLKSTNVAVSSPKLAA